MYQSIINNSGDFTIFPSETKTVLVLNDERHFVDDTYQCTSEIDSVSINVIGNKILKKDFMDSNNCIWQIDDGRNAGETSTITVTDVDFD